MNNKGRIIAAYTFLVGGPLLGLVGILHAGAHLTAPPAVHGNWVVEAGFNLWQGIACGAPLTNVPEPLLSIAQSGRELTISLNNPEKTILTGTINGTSLLAASSIARQETESTLEAAGGCQELRSLRLEAHLNDQGKKRFLKGYIWLETCADCSPLAFSAIRQAPDVKGTP